MKVLVKSIAGIGVFLLRSWTLMLFWKWFVLPTFVFPKFQLPEINLVSAGGITIVAMLLVYQYIPQDNDDGEEYWEDVFDWVKIVFAKPLGILIIGIIWHFFM